jgi:hypothetical protein
MNDEDCGYKILRCISNKSAAASWRFRLRHTNEEVTLPQDNIDTGSYLANGLSLVLVLHVAVNHFYLIDSKSV